MSSATADRLAEYRAAKAAKAEQERNKERLWDVVTLGGFRRRIGRALEGRRQQPQQEHQQEDVEELEPEPWTRLDYAILAVKLLLWACCYAVFIKLEFGAVRNCQILLLSHF